MGAPTYRFVRTYLERRPPVPLSLRQVDPLIRQLTLYRDLIDQKSRRPDMNLVELDHALRKLRLSGMADVLEPRLRQAQTEKMVPLDIVSALVSDELLRRQDRLFERRTKLARFRDPDRSLASFDFDFNKKMNRALVYELATARFVGQREDALFLGPPGTGKSHLAQSIGRAAIQQGYRVVYREAHALIEEIADATINGTTEGVPRRSRLRAAADRRRPRHAQAAAHRRRGPARARDAPLRTRLDRADLEPSRRRLGQAPRRYCRRDRAPRPAPTSRPRPEVRPQKLAHEEPNRLAAGAGYEVNTPLVPDAIGNGRF